MSLLTDLSTSHDDLDSTLPLHVYVAGHGCIHVYRTVNSWSGDSSWPTYKLCLYRFACSSLVS